MYEKKKKRKKENVDFSFLSHPNPLLLTYSLAPLLPFSLYIYLFVCLCMFISPSIYMFIYLFIYLCIYLSFHRSILILPSFPSLPTPLLPPPDPFSSGERPSASSSRETKRKASLIINIGLKWISAAYPPHRTKGQSKWRATFSQSKVSA